MTKKKERPAPQDVGLSFDVTTDGAEATATMNDLLGVATPAVEEIEAEALMPGIECPFTDGCTGKVKIHTDITRTVVRDGVPVQIRQQQLRCNKCTTIAKGVKTVGGEHRGRKFFNRVTGKAE
jgi:hypothetical protein